MTSPSAFVDLMAGPVRSVPNATSAEVTSHPWALYDPENGVETFRTREEAVAYAEGTIQEYNNDGWMEEVENVFVAHITHIPVKTVLGVKSEMTEDAWNELTAGQADPTWDDEWWRYDLVSAEVPFSDQPDATAENPYPHWGTEGPVGRIEKLTAALKLANASTKRRGEERDALRVRVAELEVELAATVKPKRLSMAQMREQGVICSWPEAGGGGHTEYCDEPMPCREHAR